MTSPQEVFKRYEKKYLLTKNQYQLLSASLHEYMTADQYGKYMISNIYFDTPNYELIRTSLEKPIYKEKLRLRSYGTPAEQDLVFIELKKKFDGIVYKRRAAMPLKNASAYLYHGKTPDTNQQIVRELNWVLKQYDLSPAAYIAYDRIALFGNEDENLRVTFDFNIRCRDSALELDKGDYGTELLKPGEVIMEVKIANTMPLWLSRLFSELQIFPTSYSKYGSYYKNYLSQKSLPEGGIDCA